MKSKISVVIPAYNIENYISATIESVLAQTYDNIEIVIVNDGSKDGTAGILDEYAAKHSCIKVIHKENGGVTSARLRGVQEATGEWIGFVDGDDLLENDMYERLMGNAEKYNADISHCGYRMEFPKGRIDYYYNTGKIVEQDNRKGLYDLLSGEYVEPALWNKIYKRTLFSDLLSMELMDKTIKNTEDLLMNYYLFRASSKSVFEDVCLYRYVLRAGSAATGKVSDNKIIDPQRVIKIIYNDICPELHDLMLGKLARSLVRGATDSNPMKSEKVKQFIKSSRKDLRKMLKKTLKAKVGKGIKIMALWVSIWPFSFKVFHKTYSKINGNDKKYDLE